jgi:hypothetical protein
VERRRTEAAERGRSVTGFSHKREQQLRHQLCLENFPLSDNSVNLSIQKPLPVVHQSHLKERCNITGWNNPREASAQDAQMCKFGDKRDRIRTHYPNSLLLPFEEVNTAPRSAKRRVSKFVTAMCLTILSTNFMVQIILQQFIVKQMIKKTPCFYRISILIITSRFYRVLTMAYSTFTKIPPLGPILIPLNLVHMSWTNFHNAHLIVIPLLYWFFKRSISRYSPIKCYMSTWSLTRAICPVLLLLLLFLLRGTVQVLIGYSITYESRSQIQYDW